MTTFVKHCLRNVERRRDRGVVEKENKSFNKMLFFIQPVLTRNEKEKRKRGESAKDDVKIKRDQMKGGNERMGKVLKVEMVIGGLGAAHAARLDKLSG